MNYFSLPLRKGHILTPDMLDTVKDIKYHVIDCGDARNFDSRYLGFITPDFRKLYDSCSKYSKIHLLAFITHEHYLDCLQNNKGICECVGYAFAKVNTCLGIPNYHCFRYIWYIENGSADYTCLDRTKSTLPISIEDLKDSFNEFCEKISYGKFTYMHPDIDKDHDIIGLIMKVPEDSDDIDDGMQVCEVYHDIIVRMILTFRSNQVYDKEEGYDFEEDADFLSEVYKTNSLEELADVLEDKVNNGRNIAYIFDDDNVTEGNMFILGMIEYTTDRIKNIYVSPEVRHWGLAKKLVQSLAGTDRTFPIFKNSLPETIAEHIGCQPITGIHFIKHNK